METVFNIGLYHFLFVSIILVGAGVATMLTKRNAIGILIGVELVLNAAGINLVAFNRYAHPEQMIRYEMTDARVADLEAMRASLGDDVGDDELLLAFVRTINPDAVAASARLHLNITIPAESAVASAHGNAVPVTLDTVNGSDDGQADPAPETRTVVKVLTVQQEARLARQLAGDPDSDEQALLLAMVRDTVPTAEAVSWHSADPMQVGQVIKVRASAIDGMTLAIFVIVLAAAEAAVALAIVLNYYNNFSSIDVESSAELKG